MFCQNCEQPLMEMEFSKGFEYVCDNWQCYMFRRPQRCRTKIPEATADGSNHWARSGPSYEAYKDRKRENYRLLRDIGIEPQKANLMSSSSKQTELALAIPTRGQE